MLCHGKPLDTAQREDFKRFIDYFVGVYSKQFYQKPENEAALREMLGEISI